MSDTKTRKKQSYKYKAEMKQLLQLIVHSLYSHKEIFLRELISNGSDALNKARFRSLTDPDMLGGDAPFEIRIDVDPEAKTLTIEDSGIGMTREDLVKRLGTVASSGTRAFVEAMQEADKQPDANMIGQFGVGFYAVFMVADKVEVETRSVEADEPAYRWTSAGTGSFSIEEIERETRGTRIILHLKDDADEFGRDYRVRDIIQKYSNFVDFPIFLGDEQVNTVKALWHKNKGDITEEELNEFYKFISNNFSPPIGHIHLHLEGRVNFRALLFVPEKAPPSLMREDVHKNLHLYSNSVFIQDDCKVLMPDYLRFVQGVVDTEDLPLNVSREVTQSSPVMAKIQTILTTKILGLLTDWAKNDPEKYVSYFKEFGSLFKLGITSDIANRDKIVELLRFESTKTDAGEYTTFREYVDRMQDDQENIYYILGEHRDVLERNPNLEYFRAKGIEVLLLSDPVDTFSMTHIQDYDGKPLLSIEKADLDLKQDEESEKDALTEEKADTVIERFKQVLGAQVETVVPSKRLVDSAATLVAGTQAMDAQVERMMKFVDKDFKPGAKVMEVNLSHPLLKNLAGIIEADADDARIDQVILQLYQGVQFLEGNLEEKSDFVDRMTNLMVKATG